MIFQDAESPADFVEAAREIFRLYVPESDAWAKPNLFDVTATVIGGMAWTAVNEAKQGVDARVNPATMIGSALDAYAAMPPIGLTRRQPTAATGYVRVDAWPSGSIAGGVVFTAASGTQYRVTTATAVPGDVPVSAVLVGSAYNSPEGQALTNANGAATSLGVYGGYDIETDSQFRRRIYAHEVKPYFFGSACSYLDVIRGVSGVTRAWAVENCGRPSIKFLMEDKYPDGLPRQSDIDDLVAMFQAECLATMFVCPIFEAPIAMTLAPEITWTCAQPAPKCDIDATLTAWLRANYGLGDAVSTFDVQTFLRDTYPDAGAVVTACNDLDPGCDGIFLNAETVGCE